jgi:hypothetical protein
MSDVRLAYRVFGESGPIVVWVLGWVVSNVETMDSPESPYAHGIELMSEVFESLGPQRLKGLPDEVDVYRAAGDSGPGTRG